MFSCCRANPKNSKKSKTPDTAAKQEQQHQYETNRKDSSSKNHNRKFVIPTITIENGKTAENASRNEKENIESVVTGCNNKQKEKSKENITTNAASEAIAKSSGRADTVKEQLTKVFQAEASATEITKTRAGEPSVDNATVSQQNDAETICSKSLQNSNNHLENRSSDIEAIINGFTPTALLESKSNQIIDGAISPLTTPNDRCDLNENTVNVGKPKSCLSRHSSTHTSIIKRVNISAHAEIIEPDPLLSIALPLTSSVGDDEDDVFSDSVPPPKRESMCAPYIERDIRNDAVVSETLVYAHGLPEWFNNERINDVGFVEPPVTPVGRDELELKRQRIYKDLLAAAQAAVRHNAHFEPIAVGRMDMHPSSLPAQNDPCRDCDPALKPSIAENLEQLVIRLEKLVERLERSLCARELEIANRAFDSVLQKRRASFDLEKAELPVAPVDNLSETEQTLKLNQRIEHIEESLGKINEIHSLNSQSDNSLHNSHIQLLRDNSLENIPIVFDEFSSSSPPPPPVELNMSVAGYQDIIEGPLSLYFKASAKIGGDVGKHAEFVKEAFKAQLDYIILATQYAQPSQSRQMELLKPTSCQITAILDFREVNRASQYFNHLSAISESIPALAWVFVAPTPGPHVKEMNDAGQFYTNRVLKEWKEKDPVHVEWARSWVQTLTELQKYIKQYHTTGLVWSGKAEVPANCDVPPPPPPMGGCPPPPPPPTFDMSNMNLGEVADDRTALFAQINQGENITKNLKKVTADMQTHKNPTLRTGPAPFKTPPQFGSANKTSVGAPAARDPVFARDGKKWLIEYQKGNNSLLVDNAEMNNVVYMFKCENSVLTVKGKVNNIVLDSCKKCSLVFDSVVASIEFVNCQSVQMQVLGFVPTVSIDKTDGCQMYLSKESLGVEIVSSKSSEMNIMLPEDGGDYTELPVPEQFKTTITGKSLKTVCVDSLG